jgi:hypothetical protein
MVIYKHKKNEIMFIILSSYLYNICFKLNKQFFYGNSKGNYEKYHLTFFFKLFTQKQKKRNVCIKSFDDS